jgi:hypothetical protein
LLSGLEAIEVKLCDVLAENPEFRLDSPFFAGPHGRNRLAIERLSYPKVRLESISRSIRKGIFDISASSYQDEGVPFIRIANLRDGLLAESDLAFISEDAHRAEWKTALTKGDIILSKTAYAAASLVNFSRCNISQDLIGIQLSDSGRKKFESGFIVAFLNSSYGHALLEQFFRGNIQAHLGLGDARRVPIPEFNLGFQRRIQECIWNADAKFQHAKKLSGAVEAVLFDGLDLKDWKPNDDLACSRSACDVFSAERLDSEYFRPRYQSLIALLRRQGKTLRDVARLREKVFTPHPGQPFHYIEIGDLAVDGATTSHEVPGEEAPSRATWIVQPGDVITSTVRPNRCLTGLIEPEQAGNICSSGFAVLTPKGIPGELLFVYLRLPIICELMDLHTTASMYPAISTTDLMCLPFLLPDDATIKKVKSQITAARAARREAHTMLEKAKQAVEIAIEKDEAAALAFLRL